VLRTRKAWTSGDENRLRDLLDAGKTAGQIANELDRTISSVYSRIHRVYRLRPMLQRRKYR
jgi:DNA-binding NarL/FixJ family response regulator